MADVRNPKQFGDVKPALPSQAMAAVKTNLAQHVRVGNLQKKF